jgi:hypothetical protein
MASIADLKVSITEMTFEQAQKVIMERRLARRQALTESFAKRDKKKASKVAKAKSKKTGRKRKAAKPATPAALAASLTPEQRQQLIASLTGGKQ